MPRPPPVTTRAPVLCPSAMFLLLRLQPAQIGVETIEALVPEAAIVLEPLGDVLERGAFETAGPPLRRAAARDQPGALQHLEMLGDGGTAHRERLGELADRALALGQPGEDGAPRRVGECRERGAEAIGRHAVMNHSVK